MKFWQARLYKKTDWQVAKKAGPVDCTTGWAGGCRKRQAGGLQERAGRRAAEQDGPEVCRKG